MKYLPGLGRSLSIVFFTLSLSISGCNSETTATTGSVTSTDTAGATSFNITSLIDVLDSIPLDTLSTAETEGLLFMREEEKLAHDVYSVLFVTWGSNIFDNIANSEQTHTEAMLVLLDRYAITDPVGNNAEGVFVDVSLQGLYDTLVSQGATSLIDALLVGAAIEEIDIIDIQNLLDTLEGNDDIALVYENLMKGSRNHLRAFARNLAELGMVYQPQYLSQDVYDAIINSYFETG